MSARGLCIGCGTERLEANIVQLSEHDGPFFDHWRRQMAKCVGAIVVDDPHTGR